jgi:glutamine amidotransferase
VSARADVAIIDSGGANLASLQFALDRLAATSVVTADPVVISSAPRVLLPGVGAAADAMRRLEQSGLPACIRALSAPVLGVCLGMQLLYERSDEGDTRCLGIVPGKVQRLTSAPRRPVPHMGWNWIAAMASDPLLAGVGERDYVYFVHSYAAPHGPDTTATVDYGAPLTAVVRRGNFHGVQFHPERSGMVGARILKNFLELA